ncbi:VQ motif-containing protein 31-like [Henckelia pumila]|uniref:VQ motif-containing protein 31-like n=1 Tax=Henckelia pumila TaxID=405737 RepID=UPI003C6E1063
MTKLLLGSSTGAESPSGITGGGGYKGATTFVQADSTCFRDLVQRLTGPSIIETAQPVAAVVKAPKKPTTELHERRKLYARPNIEIARPASSFKVHQLPPSILQVSPISSCSHTAAPYSHACGSNKRVVSEAAGDHELLVEEKDGKEKRSYLLQPSPRSKPRLDLEDDNGASTVSAQPKLLTLFPLTSPTSADAN